MQIFPQARENFVFRIFSRPYKRSCLCYSVAPVCRRRLCV